MELEEGCMGWGDVGSRGIVYGAGGPVGPCRQRVGVCGASGALGEVGGMGFWGVVGVWGR